MNDEPSVIQYNAKNRETGKWLFAWPYRAKSQCSRALYEHVRYSNGGSCWGRQVTTREVRKQADAEYEIVALKCVPNE